MAAKPRQVSIRWVGSRAGTNTSERSWRSEVNRCVFLDTFPLTGGYSCREVLAKGKPIVHMHSADMPNLNAFLDGELQASDAREYVAHVSRLLSDEAFYRRACTRSVEISKQQADLRPFASTLHSALRKIMNSVTNPDILRPETVKTLALAGRDSAATP